MDSLKNMLGWVRQLKENSYDFFEAVLIFIACIFSTFAILSIHSSFFFPYFDKSFLLELSISLTMATGCIMMYEWYARKR